MDVTSLPRLGRRAVRLDHSESAMQVARLKLLRLIY